MNQKHVTVDSDDLNLRTEFEEHVLLNGDEEIINARLWLEQVCAHIVPNDESSPVLYFISRTVLLIFSCSATTAAISD